MKDPFFARLTVHDFAKMPKKQREFFVKWLRSIATEMKSADSKIYSNPFRCTLYK